MPLILVAIGFIIITWVIEANYKPDQNDRWDW